jgi:hypothetical protein
MNLAERAVFDFYNGFLDNRKISLKYSGRFKGFNANVTYTNRDVVFNLSKAWLEFSEEIRIGLIQSLALKVFKKEGSSLELDLYYKFVSNLPKYAKVDKNDPLLEDSFKRINFKYFENSLTRPNLVWGLDAFTKLGHYEHQTDTVLISNIFKKDLELLDYIMFHELLHKKHGIMRTKTGRAIHHSREFREEEKTYLDKDVEKKLRIFVRKKRFKNWLGF